METNCYLLCKNGENLMPAHFQGIDEETGLAVVTSPNGAEYTTAPQHLVSVEDGQDMLRDKRADRLIHQGYVTMKLRGNAWRVWSPARHGVNGGYICTEAELPACTCCDFLKRRKPCKHLRALPGLQRFAQVEKPTVRVRAATAPAPDAAAVAAARRTRFAAMVAEDFA